MPETKIDVTELKTESGDLVKDLADYVKEKTKADVETTTDELLVKTGDKPVSRKNLRVVLRKFLHREQLTDYFRVIGKNADTLVIKEKKVEEEEE